METSKKYTDEELTTLFLEAIFMTLKAHAQLDIEILKAKSEINEMFNARIKSYVENSELKARLS